MNYLIEEPQQLQALIPLFERIRAEPENNLVAVDTEFLREKTYNAKLCLIQLGIGQDQYCIDVLGVGDLSPVSELFIDESVVKLFHAARQDMEVIWQTLGVLPKPVFDTQLAAAFCGMDLQIGHTALVAEALGVELSKSQARTDWSKRPLSSQQLAYAAEDVEHLAKLYTLLNADLDRAGKRAFFDEEILDFYRTEKYVMPPALAYQRLSGGGFNLKQQYVLQALAEWRERQAQKRDIPRTWVLKDDKLYMLASKCPSSEDEIKRLEIFSRRSVERMAPLVLDVIAGVTVGSVPIWSKIEPLDKLQKGLCSKMMKLLKTVSEEQKIAQGLLGTRKDIEGLFRYRRSTKLLNGWRTALIGTQLLDFVERS